MFLLLSSLALAAPLPVDPAVTATQELTDATPGILWRLAFDVRKGPDGRLYLTNASSVHAFDPATGAVSLFATAQSTALERYVYQVGWTSDGTMYASEFYGGVSAFSSTGAPLWYLPTDDCMVGLTVTGDDRVLASSFCDGAIYEIDTANATSQLEALMPFDPSFDRPTCVRLFGMTTDAQGEPWVSDQGCDSVQFRRYADADARPVEDRWEAMYTGQSPAGYGYDFMTFMPDGTAFFSSYQNEIYRVPPGGTPELFATQAMSAAGVGLYYDDASSKLYAFATDGLWSFDVQPTPPPIPTLTWSGTCPGPATLAITGMTPNGALQVVSSSQAGTFAVRNGPCAGYASGLGTAGIRLRANLIADAHGEASLDVLLPAAACGTYQQALDLDTCTFTHVTQR